MSRKSTSPCLADQVTPHAWLPLQLLPWLAAAPAVALWFVTEHHVKHTAGAAPLSGLVLFKLAVALLSVVVACAAASCVVFVYWLVGILDLCRAKPGWRLGAWGLVPLIGLVALWAVVSFGPVRPTDPVEGALARGTRLESVITILLVLPGLVAILAIRYAANNDDNWTETGRCRLLLLRRLRNELRRLLVIFAGLLTLVVIATGMRLRAVLVVEPTLQAPNEQVILYGLAFGALLAGFYLISAPAIDRRAQALIDEFAPTPDPSSPGLSDDLKRRAELSQFLGASEPMRNLPVVLAIALPLVSALIGVSGAGH
jgi:hypothetical protein